MLSVAFVAFANHLLESASWARDKLSAHAGKTALFDVFPTKLAFAVARTAGCSRRRRKPCRR